MTTTVDLKDELILQLEGRISELEAEVETLRIPDFDPPSPFWRWVLHNTVAHPLIVLCPPVGRRLHDWSIKPWEDE